MELKWHELVSHAFLAWEDGQLHQLLEQHEEGTSSRIRYLLNGMHYLSFIPRLLVNDVDVDRADYIRRDTHHTGVAYGRYDLDWLISTCTIGEVSYGDTNKFILGFDERKAIRVIEQFLIARGALYETVYHHKTVRCAEGMIALFLRRLKYAVGNNDKIHVPDFVMPILKTARGEILDIPELFSIDDYSLSVLISIIAESNETDDTLSDLASRILRRDLFKYVPLESSKIESFLTTNHAMEKIAESIKPFCTGDPEYYYFIDTFEFNMLSDKEKEFVYLINEERNASPAKNHISLRGYQQANRKNVRLFTINEAVEAVQIMIEES